MGLSSKKNDRERDINDQLLQEIPENNICLGSSDDILSWPKLLWPSSVGRQEGKSVML